MKTICTTIRCPCVIIIISRDNIADKPLSICDSGHLIFMVAEKRLLMTAYVAMHQSRTSRPIDSQLMTRAFNMFLAPLREQELAYSEPQETDNPLKDTSMSKWIKS